MNRRVIFVTRGFNISQINLWRPDKYSHVGGPIINICKLARISNMSVKRVPNDLAFVTWALIAWFSHFLLSFVELCFKASNNEYFQFPVVYMMVYIYKYNKLQFEPIYDKNNKEGHVYICKSLGLRGIFFKIN